MKGEQSYWQVQVKNEVRNFALEIQLYMATYLSVFKLYFLIHLF
jgi:hypothetical protein